MPKPPGDKPLRYRELRNKLRKFGVTESIDRGKGSNRGFFHPNIHGQLVWHFVKCHGEGDVLSKAVVGAARRKFDIKPEDFY